MAAQVLLYLAYFAYLLIGVEGWRCAKYQHYFSQQPDYIDCLWDCCGNSFNRHCCAPIGIIVGIAIVGAVVVAALVVLLACWWQRRRARHSSGPRLFHNRRHSHYPVAPASVTRPAPLMGYQGQEQHKPPPPGPGYRPPAAGRNPEKPPLDDEYYSSRPYTDRPGQERLYQDRPYQDRPYQERSGQERPYQDRPGPPRGRPGPPPSGRNPTAPPSDDGSRFI